MKKRRTLRLPVAHRNRSRVLPLVIRSALEQTGATDRDAPVGAACVVLFHNKLLLEGVVAPVAFVLLRTGVLPHLTTNDEYSTIQYEY